MAEDPASLAARRRIYDLVVASPGLTAREIHQAAGGEWGEVAALLLRLEEIGHVKRERGERFEFYFACAVEPRDPALRRLAGSAAMRRLAIALLEVPGATLPELSERLHRGEGSLAVLLRPALDAGVVGTTARGPWVTFGIADRKLLGELLGGPSGGLGHFVDGECEVWGNCSRRDDPARATMTATRSAPRPDPAGRRRGIRAGDGPTLLPGFAVLAVVLIVAAAGPGARSHASGDDPTLLQWGANATASNGIVRMALGNLSQAISAGPANRSDGLALTVGLTGLQEIGANGALISWADFQQLPNGSVPGLVVVNRSTPQALVLDLSQPFGVLRPNHPGPVASAQLDLNLTSGGTRASAGNVSLGLAINGWPWVHPGDALVISLSAVPQNASVGVLSNGTTNELDCLATSPRSPIAESIHWPSTVLAVDPAGDRFVIGVASTVAGSPQNATIQIGVPSASGGYSEIDAGLQLEIPTRPTPAPLPVGLVILCVGWAVVVGTVIWVTVRRTGSSPSALTRTDADDPPRTSAP